MALSEKQSQCGLRGTNNDNNQILGGTNRLRNNGDSMLKTSECKCGGGPMVEIESDLVGYKAICTKCGLSGKSSTSMDDAIKVQEALVEKSLCK